MKIQQLSIFVENREGRLAQITEVLAAAQIDIRAISVADTSDFGMRILADHHITVEYMYAFISRDKGKAFVIIRVDNDEKAMEALRDAGVVLLSAEEIHGM